MVQSKTILNGTVCIIDSILLILGGNMYASFIKKLS